MNRETVVIGLLLLLLWSKKSVGHSTVSITGAKGSPIEGLPVVGQLPVTYLEPQDPFADYWREQDNQFTDISTSHFDTETDFERRMRESQPRTAFINPYLGF